MKTLVILTVLLAILGYSSNGVCSGLFGTKVNEQEVIKKVAFDKNCPEEQIAITAKLVKKGQGSYKVKACGKDFEYEHAGTVIWEKGHGPLDK